MLTIIIVSQTLPFSCTVCAISGIMTIHYMVCPSLILRSTKPVPKNRPTDGIPVLQNLQLPYIVAEGYVNLRCAWTLGCPAEIKPTMYAPDAPTTEKHYEDGFKELFPNTTVPEVVGVGCCAQFAVTREKLLDRPSEDYERYRRWLLGTPLEDDISGRIMEYSWHSTFPL